MSLNSQPSSLYRNHAFQRNCTASNSESAQKFYTELLAMTRLAGARTGFGVHARVGRWNLALHSILRLIEKQIIDQRS
eukprot:3929121-Pleurochrysis_carterae.AAC.1